MYIVLQRIKKALLLSYNVSSGKAKVTEEDRKEIRCELTRPHVEYFQLEFLFSSVVHFVVYGIQAQLAETFVDNVFGGRLVSTVVCLECGNVRS